MQRRKFIAGMGSLAAAGAAGIGTGAFTSVEADRSLSIDTAGDANAFLGFTKAGPGDESGPYPNAREYVDLPDDGQISLDFTQSDDTAGSASGINENAKTTFDNLFDVTNNGTQEVVLSVKSDLIASQGGFLGIYAENTLGDGGSDNTGLSHEPNATGGGSNTNTGYWGHATIGVGESLENIGISIPKGHSTGDLSGGTLTFIAERTGGNQD